MALLVNPSSENLDGAISEKINLILLGDVNGDGFINQEDVNLIYNSLDTQVQVSLGGGNYEFKDQKATVKLTPEQKSRADVDNDGIVTARDAAIINKYIWEKQSGQLQPANYLVELIAIKNKVNQFEAHNYQDKNNRINNADTKQLISSGASDLDIVGSMLVNKLKAPVNIDVANAPKEELIYQMLAGNVEKDLSLDLDKSGNITINDYNVARGLNIDTSIQATEENLKPKPEPIVKTGVEQIRDMTYQQPETETIKEVIMDAKILPAPTPIIEDGTFTSGSPTYPIGGGSLPGGGVPVYDNEKKKENDAVGENLDTFKPELYNPTVPKDLVTDLTDGATGSEKGTAPVLSSGSNFGMIAAGLILFFLIFSD